MEGVAAHEVDGGEGEAVLAVRAVVREEGLGCRLQLPELVAALLALADVLAHRLLILFDVGVVLLESAWEGAYFCRKKLLT